MQKQLKSVGVFFRFIKKQRGDLISTSHRAEALPPHLLLITVLWSVVSESIIMLSCFQLPFHRYLEIVVWGHVGINIVIHSVQVAWLL